MMSTCEYREEYQCLRYAKCEEKSTGLCAWNFNSKSYKWCIEKFQCKVGERRKADDACNYCTCGKDGKWACTEKSCQENKCEKFIPPCKNDKQCARGEKCIRGKSCNPSYCRCNKDTGLTMCTKDCGGGVCTKIRDNDDPINLGCLSNNDCLTTGEAKEYCEKEINTCEKTNARGKCQRIPNICPKYLKPVCGCDKKTYNNDCERAKAGVSKFYEGTCKKF